MVEVAAVRALWAAVRKHWLVLAILVLASVVALASSNSNGLVALFVLGFLAGVAAAVVAAAHPLRNGTIGGVIAPACVIGIVLVEALLGRYELAEGETWGSFWLEVPVWLIIILVPAALLGLLGGAIVSLARLANQRMHPR
jgi:hypothetical protein